MNHQNILSLQDLQKFWDNSKHEMRKINYTIKLDLRNISIYQLHDD